MKKACSECRIFVEGPTCPVCKGNKFSENWKGRIYIVDPNRSEVAKNLNLKVKGEYAVKVK
ncbi:MAG: transcription elongation factor subunit Spt4 [Nanoarchaeota archaeon]